MEINTKFAAAAFLSDNSGAVTADWLALTAGMMMLGMMTVYTVFNSGVAALTASTNQILASAAVGAEIGNPPYFDGAVAFAAAEEQPAPAGTGPAATEEPSADDGPSTRKAEKADRTEENANRHAKKKDNGKGARHAA